MRLRIIFLSLAAAAGLGLAGLFFCARTAPKAARVAPAPEPLPDLASLVETLSEPGGYFDTDNLISNETSYLQVSDALGDRSLKGGVYLGVGPDQNFTYIARTRPRWAFILDIRRQNMLELLLFNALFEKAATPWEYLSLLLSRDGRARPPEDAGLGPLLAALEPARPTEEAFARNLNGALDHIEHRLRFPLTEEDRSAIGAVYREFFEGQLELKFRSHGKPPMPYHPTLRELLLARSPSGREGHFLASPEDYRYVRELHRAGRVVPVVGDFAGPRSLKAIGDFLRTHGETVSVFYVSNVEFYLVRSGRFDQYVANVGELPVGKGSLFIRSYFDYGLPHPAGLPGQRSTTILQPIPRFLALYESGAYRSYWDVCTRDYLR